uniref:Saposin B-type domain-containing protein n=1 Tax=Plectus sambesii TaxID=2011161 RepID=A0A914X9H9_9BILA
MKVLIVLAALCAFVFAKPQDKSLAQDVECDICHYLCPSLEDWVDQEGELADDFLKKECAKIPLIGKYCDEWLEKNVDPIIKLLAADECYSACFACDEVLKCGTDKCKPTCRKNCPAC